MNRNRVILAMLTLSAVVQPGLAESPVAPSPLEGDWVRCSASYQTAGNQVYRFRGNRVTIESSFAFLGKGYVKRRNLPVETVVSHYRFEIDRSRKPHRLITYKLESPKQVARIDAFEFRDGQLWLVWDTGQEIRPGTLKPGGRHGWLTGLAQMEAEVKHR